LGIGSFFWAKDKSIGNNLINARFETLSEKPSFKKAYRRQRCIIPADGFFEWRQIGDARHPSYIHSRSGAPLLMAGLWDSWKDSKGKDLRSCTIITTAANEYIKFYQHRMPVFLEPTSLESWLDPTQDDLALVDKLVTPTPDDFLAAYDVTRLMNNPSFNSEDCLVPI